MRFGSRRTTNFGVRVAIVAVLFLIGASAWAQDGAYEPPRTAQGRADLNGIWQALNTANYDIRPHAARPGLALSPAPAPVEPAGTGRATTTALPVPEVRALGAVGGVPGGQGVVVGGAIPYQSWAAARQQENAANWLERDPEIRCFMPGVPRATYMPYPFQVIQGADKILIAYEFGGFTRTIHMDDVPNSPSPTWMGWSRGRWDGDTLVVDVTSFNGNGWFDRAGNFHSDALHVVERYTRIGPDHLMYEATIEDPDVFTEPWQIRMPLYRRLEADARLLEYECVEFVEQLMYGDVGLIDPATGERNE